MTNFVGSVIKGVQCLVLRGIATLVSLLCCTQWATAQIQVEYFWNKDNGLGKCTRVGGEARVGGELTFALPTDTLPYGVNLLGVRAFVESDTATYWSPTLYSYIVKPLPETQVREIEYFWDNDPGLGNATKVAGGTAKVGESVSFNIPTDTLSPGVHRLGVRAKDVGWSPTIYSYIAKPLPETQVREIEYFWDNDPGLGNATKVAGGTAKVGESVSFNIPTDTLAPGVHRLGVRAKDVGWSPTVYRLVAVKANGPESCAQYIEYFWDKDPGFGNGMREELQPNAAGNTVSFEVSTAGLTNGVHTLYARTKAIGWSPLVCYYVRVQDSEVQVIDDIEYFWDEDPGYGNGHKVMFEQGSSVDIKDFEPEIDGLTGAHLFCMRAHSSGGWSVIYTGKVLFSVEGYYTMNEQLADSVKRNYRSVAEMVDNFVEYKVTADVTVELRDGATFDYTPQGEDEFAKLDSVVRCLEQCDARLNFKAATSGTLNVTVDESMLGRFFEFAKFIDTENVQLCINGNVYDFSLLAYTADDVCASGGSCEAREWSTIGDSVVVEWKAAPHNGCKITGYIEHGTGDLPAMQLGNSGAAADYIDYDVSLLKDSVVVLGFTYRINVGNTIAGKSVTFTNSTPADGGFADPGAKTIYWNEVSGANAYLVVVEAYDEVADTTVCDTIIQTGKNYRLQVEENHTYRYSVQACAKCDSTAFASRTLLSFRTNDDDIASLALLYDSLGGTKWNKKWLFGAKTQASTNYPGVTFDTDGRVTAMNLSKFGLTGELPADGFVLPRLATLDLSRNSITGDVPSFIDECETLTSLNMGYNRLSTLSATLPARITSLNLNGQFYNSPSLAVEVLPISEIFMDKNNMNGVVAGDFAWYDHKAQDMSSRTAFSIYDSSLSTAWGRLNYSNELYTLELNREYTLGQDADVLLMCSSGVAKYSLFPAKFSYLPGDANIDANLDILDVQHTVNYAVGANGAKGVFNRSAANAYADATINVQDIVVMVNMILDEDLYSMNLPSKAAVFNDAVVTAAADAKASMRDGVLHITTLKEIAALDIEIDGAGADDFELLLDNRHFTASIKETAGGLRVIIFSLNGAVLPVGSVPVISLNSNASVVEVAAADADALPVMVAVGDSEHTDIPELTDADDVAARIVNGKLHLYTMRDYDGVAVQVNSIDGRLLYAAKGIALNAGCNVVPVDNIGNGVFLLSVKVNGEWRYIKLLN